MKVSKIDEYYLFGGAVMKKKNVLLIAIIVFLILAITITVVFYMLSINKTKNTTDNPIKIDKNVVMYQFENAFVNNLKESKKLLKVTISLELANGKIQELVDGRKPEILNNINSLVREKTEEDLAGAEGQKRLQKEILSTIRKMLNTEKVINVYFHEFIVQ